MDAPLNSIRYIFQLLFTYKYYYAYKFRHVLFTGEMMMTDVDEKIVASIRASKNQLNNTSRVPEKKNVAAAVNYS